MTFKYILRAKPQVSENSNNKIDCELSIDYLRSLNSAWLEQVPLDPKRSTELGPEWKETPHLSARHSLSPLWSWQTSWCSCLRAECLLSHTSALPQACPGAGGKLWVYGLCHLKSCSCSLLLLVTWSNFTAWSFQSGVSYRKGVINNSLEDILKCHPSWLNPIVGY